MNENQQETAGARRSNFREAEFDLKPYLHTLWQNKKRAGIFMGGALLLFVFMFFLILVVFPRERVTQATVRFLFAGAEQGEYPNGDRFSPMELISTLNLEEVYVANELEKTVPFNRFKNSFTVIQQNPEQDALEADYEARMADTKMAAVERDRLLREFRAKQAALRSAEFQLIYLERSARPLVSTQRMKKVVADVIATWARNADQRKGAMAYRVPVLSPKMVYSQISQVGGDPVVALDILRNQIAKILANIDKIDYLPGASFIRDEKEESRLVDIRNRLMELDRYQINPLIGQVRTQGYSADPAATINYLENQLFQLNIQRKAAQARVKLLEDSLKSYLQDRGGVAPAAAPSGAATAVIPQVSADFFERIMEMGQEGSDQEYRKEITERIIESGNDLVAMERDTRYYEEFLATFRSRGAAIKVAAEKMKYFENRYQTVAATVIDSLKAVNQIYERISKNNLNPDSLLYSLDSPPSSSSQLAFSTRMLLLLFLFYWFLVALAGIVYLVVLKKKGEIR